MLVIKKANTTIGIPGTFSARLQPNDTRDDVQSIAAQIYEGLSFGVGDAVIGVNPVTDDVENLSRVLDTIYGVIDKFNIPTQGCVLAHVTTQIEAIRRGAPGGLIFQSICGSEKGLKEFGVELAMLDEARAVGAEFNRIAGENCLYFETGQGSALSAGANFGADQGDDGLTHVTMGWRVITIRLSSTPWSALLGRSISTATAIHPCWLRRSLYGQAERHLYGL